MPVFLIWRYSAGFAPVWFSANDIARCGSLLDPAPFQDLEPVLSLELRLLDICLYVSLEEGMVLCRIVHAGEKDKPGILGYLRLVGILCHPMEKIPVSPPFDIDRREPRRPVTVAGDLQGRFGFDIALLVDIGTNSSAWRSRR
jgi:hypothetical protein